MLEVQALTVNWDRSIMVDAPLDDELVRKLTPRILALRQESEAPITVGIDSPGGSLASLEVLLGLLTGPTQYSSGAPIVTVAVNRAYSAAANLLAFGSYSVALQHSRVLYHDVRFGGMDDVTPAKARDAAKSLQDLNDTFSLRLAHRVIKRLIWVYIDLRTEFEGVRKSFPKTHKRYSESIAYYAPAVDGFECIDLASFATCLWRKLSRDNDSLIRNVMNRLDRWIRFTHIARSAPAYKPKGSRLPGMLDGPRHMHKLFDGRPEHFTSSEASLKLLLSLLVADIATTKAEKVNFSQALERATHEFSILESMNDARHISYAADLMAQHSHVFFGTELAGDLLKMPEEQRRPVLDKASPHARLLWHFCVLLCRELFEGEHVLQPHDAQLLGVVDEVTGGGAVMSRREFIVESAQRQPVQNSATGGEPPPN